MPVATTRTINSSGRGSQRSKVSMTKGPERSRTTAALICIPARASCFDGCCAFARSIVAVDALAPLVAFLGLNRQGCYRPSFEALERDRLAGFFAIAISAVLDSLQCSIDLCDQLALTIPRAQFDGAIGFRGGAIGKVGVILALVLQMLDRLLGLF